MHQIYGIEKAKFVIEENSTSMIALVPDSRFWYTSIEENGQASIQSEEAICFDSFPNTVGDSIVFLGSTWIEKE